MPNAIDRACTEYELCGCTTADDDLHCTVCLAPAVEHSESVLSQFLRSGWPDADKHRVAVATGLMYQQSDNGVEVAVAARPQQPSFAEASASFRDFVAQASLPASIEWLFCENVLQFGKHLFVCHASHGNLQLAKDLFTWGFRAGLGASLEVLGSTSQTTFAYVDVPLDARDAELRLISGTHVKMSAPETSRWRIVTVDARWTWQLLRVTSRLFGRRWYQTVLPSRRESLRRIAA